MPRKTITVTEKCYDSLCGVKSDDESWTECLLRLRNEAESGDECGVNTATPLTEDHIDDIATRTAAQTATEVENRLTER